MKEGLNCTEIATNFGRSKSTIFKGNNAGRGYRPKQADRLAEERSISSRNAPDVLKATFIELLSNLAPSRLLQN